MTSVEGSSRWPGANSMSIVPPPTAIVAGAKLALPSAGLALTRDKTGCDELEVWVQSRSPPYNPKFGAAKRTRPNAARTRNFILPREVGSLDVQCVWDSIEAAPVGQERYSCSGQRKQCDRQHFTHHD
jgi:hypothetical protein